MMRMLSSSGKVASTGVAVGASRSKTEEEAVEEVLGESLWKLPSLSKTVGQGFSCPCLNLHCLQARGLLAGMVSARVETITILDAEPACVRLERCSQAVCVLASLPVEIVCVPALSERKGYEVYPVHGDSNSAALCWCLPLLSAGRRGAQRCSLVGDGERSSGDGLTNVELLCW